MLQASIKAFRLLASIEALCFAAKHNKLSSFHHKAHPNRALAFSKPARCDKCPLSLLWQNKEQDSNIFFDPN